MGLLFLKNPPFYWNRESDNFPLLPLNDADINYTEVIDDSLGWTLIEGVFIADDNYSHIAIGNFYNDDNTIIVASDVDEGCLAMYYIDLVCIIKEGGSCDIASSISEYEIRKVLLHNIVHDELYISNIDQFVIEQLLIYNLSGKLLVEKNYFNERMDVSYLSQGMYILQVKFKDGISNNYKFIKE